ncbi:MAG: polysaccharide deacetylase family protein [Acidobacteria bacterium]|nr:polysaccharide deacetylase family protein [Acidobacteriota bacterium]
MDLALPIAGVSALAGSGICAWGACHPLSQIFGSTIRYTENPKTVALTFDDGPNPATTPALLDLLEEHHARASFFVIGKYVRECPDLTREICRRGHVLGNHTENHVNLFWSNTGKIGEELALCKEAIQSATNAETHWMRPPWGYRGPQLNPVIRQKGFSGVVMWSALAWDWYPQPVARTIQKLSKVRGGDIVLMHDGFHVSQGADRAHVLGALKHWLPRWRDAGLEFVTLDECAGRKSPAA